MVLASDKSVLRSALGPRLTHRCIAAIVTLRQPRPAESSRMLCWQMLTRLAQAPVQSAQETLTGRTRHLGQQGSTARPPTQISRIVGMAVRLKEDDLAAFILEASLGPGPRPGHALCHYLRGCSSCLQPSRCVNSNAAKLTPMEGSLLCGNSSDVGNCPKTRSRVELTIYSLPCW